MPDDGSDTVAIVHDYLTQRGGAERVVLTMTRVFPSAPIHTSLYEPRTTYEEFSGLDVRPSSLNRFAVLRREHRLALPLLARTFSELRVDAPVALCSSSGWAHGVSATGRKIVYCYSPAKWLHQPDRYRTGGLLGGLARRGLRRRLLAWDLDAAASADRYLVTSSAVQGWVRDAYGIDAEIVPPPGGVDATGDRRAVAGLEPGFFLTVGRLLDYKNVEQIVEAFTRLPDQRLVVVGSGPRARAVSAAAGANVRVLDRVSDGELRWLYDNAQGLIAAAREDYGLTPLEAASFGTPCAALRWGGFLDTVDEGRTGLLFDDSTPEQIAGAAREVAATTWDASAIRAHAAEYSEARFGDRLRAIVLEEADR